MRGAGATRDDGEDVYLSSGPVVAESVGERVYLLRMICARWERL
jgi:hypothetical protein